MALKRPGLGQRIHKLIQRRASWNLRHRQMSWDKALYHAIGSVEADLYTLREANFAEWDRLMREKPAPPAKAKKPRKAAA